MIAGSGFLAARVKHSDYSRATLNKYSPADLEKDQRFKFYTSLIDIICSQVDSILATSDGNVKKCVYKNIRCVKLWKPNSYKGDPFNYYHSRVAIPGEDTRADPEAEKYLPEFIELLQNTFVDCRITMDPLKTYLIIDWS
jgi:hypothetical protein